MTGPDMTLSFSFLRSWTWSSLAWNHMAQCHPLLIWKIVYYLYCQQRLLNFVLKLILKETILGILKKKNLILPKSCCYQLTCNKWLHWKVPPIFERKFLSACPINEHRNRSHKTTILYRQSKSGPTFLHLSEGRLQYLDGLQLPGLTRSNWVCHTIQQNLLKKPINN